MQGSPNSGRRDLPLPPDSGAGDSGDDASMVPYEPRRPINKGKVVLILTVIFVSVLVRRRNDLDRQAIDCNLFHSPRLLRSSCWPSARPTPLPPRTTATRPLCTAREASTAGMEARETETNPI